MKRFGEKNWIVGSKREDLLNEVHEMQNLMEYMNGGFTNEAEPVVEPSQEQTSPIDVQKFIDKIKSLPILLKLKDKLNTKKERILGIRAIAELFELNDAELVKASQEIKKMDGVVTEEVIDEGLADDISIEYNIEALIQKIAREKKQHPSTVAIILSKIADRINAKKNRPT